MQRASLEVVRGVVKGVGRPPTPSALSLRGRREWDVACAGPSPTLCTLPDDAEYAIFGNLLAASETHSLEYPASAASQPIHYSGGFASTKPSK